MYLSAHSLAHFSIMSFNLFLPLFFLNIFSPLNFTISPFHRNHVIQKQRSQFLLLIPRNAIVTDIHTISIMQIHDSSQYISVDRGPLHQLITHLQPKLLPMSSLHGKVVHEEYLLHMSFIYL